MRRHFWIAGLACLGLAACGSEPADDEAVSPAEDGAQAAGAPVDPEPEPAPEPDSAFSIDDGAFAQSSYFGGYFIPSTEVMLGAVRLEHFALGTPEELAAYEGPTEDLPFFAPFLAEFADTSSERLEGELGPYYATSYRLLPDSYAIAGDAAVFTAAHEVLGAVRIEGRFTEAGLAGWGENADFIETAFIADIMIGDQVFEGVEMNFWVGD
jgi:hypothetical protein